MTRARSVEDVLRTTEVWQQAGGGGVSVLTQKVGLESVAAHVDYLGRVKEAFDARYA